MASTTYHSLLRILTGVVVCMLVFQSGMLSPVTTELTRNTGQYLANAVGVSVGVAPTELNQVTAALTARERDLEARELAVAEREISVGINDGGSIPLASDARTTFVLAAILFILLVLIVLNYVLDYLRSREQLMQTGQSTPIASL